MTYEPCAEITARVLMDIADHDYGYEYRSVYLPALDTLVITERIWQTDEAMERVIQGANWPDAYRYTAKFLSQLQMKNADIRSSNEPR